MKRTDGPEGTHYILPELKNKLEAKAARMTARAAKLGQVPEFQVDFLGPAVFERSRLVFDGDGNGREVKTKIVREAVNVTGDAPTVGGFKLVAKLTHTEAGTLFLKAPGWTGTLAPEARDSNACDHCKTARARKDTFLVQDKASGFCLRVGRSCLRDYCEASAETALALWNMLEEIEASEGSEEMDGWGGDSSYGPEMGNFIACALASVDLDGWRRSGHEDGSTKSAALFACGKRPIQGGKMGDALREQWDAGQPTDEHRAEALWALEWIRTGAEGVPDGDYGHNLQVACAPVVVLFEKRRSGAGIAASLAFCWRRFWSKLARPEPKAKRVSVHFGTIGERYIRKVKIAGVRDLGADDWGGTTVLYLMTDCETGGILKWFKSGYLHSEDYTRQEEGAEIELQFTVKDHGEWKETKDTVISRGKIVEGKRPKWLGADGRIFKTRKALNAAAEEKAA